MSHRDQCLKGSLKKKRLSNLRAEILIQAKQPIVLRVNDCIAAPSVESRDDTLLNKFLTKEVKVKSVLVSVLLIDVMLMTMLPPPSLSRSRLSSRSFQVIHEQVSF